MKPTLRSLSLLAGLALASALPAAAGWAPVGGTPLTYVSPRLTAARPERLYAEVYDFGINATYLWRSEDAGATWRDVQTGLERPVQALATDPTNPDALWVWTTDWQLWHSADAGSTWSRRPSLITGFLPAVVQLLVDPRHPGTLYRAELDDNQPRVAVSRDGGATFTPGAVLASVYSVVLHADRGELFSYTQGGLLVSLDGGQSWHLRGRFRQTGFGGGDLAPSAPDTHYAFPARPGQCLARSDDDGAHWQALASPRLPAADCRGLAIDPRDARHVWVTASSPLGAKPPGVREYLLESRDGGTSWSRPFPLPAFGVVAAGGELLYTLAGTGLSVSRDGGRSWERRDHGIVAGDVRAGLVAQRPPGGGAGRRLLGLTTGDSSNPWLGLHRSDGGTDWTATGFYPSSLADAGGSTAVIADFFIFRSRDGGTTWHEVPSAPHEPSGLRSNLTEPRYLSLLHYEDTNPDGSFAFWMSDAAGLTWRRAGAGLAVDCVDIANQHLCPQFDAYAVDPFDPSRRWVTTDAANVADAAADPPQPTLFVSQDAGVSWQVATTALPHTQALAADPAVPGRLLAGTDGGLFASADGGAHWLPLGDLPDGAVIRQFARDGRSASWYAATTGYGIFRSLDAGAHWTLLAGAPDHDNPTIAVDPRRPTALLAAFSGQGVWRWTP